MTETTAIPTVVVAGGGYAGLLAANRLAGRLGTAARVVLVTPGDQLVDRIRLHETAARGRRVEHALSRLLHPAIERIDARVIGVDPTRQQLTIARAGASESLHFDWLVLALGSRLAASVPSSSRHAHALASPASARALHEELRALPAGSRVAVVGGGLTAIELSSEIAEAHPRLSVDLYSSELVPGLPGAVRARLQQALADSGVSVHTGRRVAELTASAVRFADGTQVEVAIGVLTSGFAPSALGSGFMLPSDEQGRVPVDEQLRVHGLHNVFAVGDLAAPPASSIGSGRASTRMGCVSAMPLGAHAADQVVRAIEKRPLQPFHFDYFVQCISVGRRQGVVVSVTPDDQPTGRVLSGRAGALVKELICRFVVAAIRLERAFAGLYAWPGRRALPRLPRAVANRLPG